MPQFVEADGVRMVRMVLDSDQPNQHSSSREQAT